MFKTQEHQGLNFFEVLQLTGIKTIKEAEKAKFLFDRGAVLTLLTGNKKQIEDCLKSYGYKE